MGSRQSGNYVGKISEKTDRADGQKAACVLQGVGCRGPSANSVEEDGR